MTHINCRLCRRAVRKRSASRTSALCRGCAEERGVCNDERDQESDSGCTLRLYHEGTHMSVNGRTWLSSGILGSK